MKVLSRLPMKMERSRLLRLFVGGCVNLDSGKEAKGTKGKDGLGFRWEWMERVRMENVTRFIGKLSVFNFGIYFLLCNSFNACYVYRVTSVGTCSSSSPSSVKIIKEDNIYLLTIILFPYHLSRM